MRFKAREIELRPLYSSFFYPLSAGATDGRTEGSWAVLGFKVKAKFGLQNQRNFRVLIIKKVRIHITMSYQIRKME